MVIVETIFIPQMLKGTRPISRERYFSSHSETNRNDNSGRGEKRGGKKKKEKWMEEECNEAWYRAVAVEAGWVPTEFFSITDLYFIHKNRRIYSFGYARF